MCGLAATDQRPAMHPLALLAFDSRADAGARPDLNPTSIFPAFPPICSLAASGVIQHVWHRLCRHSLEPRKGGIGQKCPAVYAARSRRLRRLSTHAPARRWLVHHLLREAQALARKRLEGCRAAPRVDGRIGAARLHVSRLRMRDAHALRQDARDP